VETVPHSYPLVKKKKLPAREDVIEANFGVIIAELDYETKVNVLSIPPLLVSIWIYIVF